MVSTIPGRSRRGLPRESRYPLALCTSMPSQRPRAVHEPAPIGFLLDVDFRLTFQDSQIDQAADDRADRGAVGSVQAASPDTDGPASPAAFWRAGRRRRPLPAWGAVNDPETGKQRVMSVV